jgi:flagellar protein FlaG
MSSELSVNSSLPIPTPVVGVPVMPKPAPAVTPQPVKEVSKAISKTEADIEAERMKKSVQEALSKLNEMMMTGGRSLRFVMDEKLGRPIIYVENTVTGEIVRQIPDETVLRVARGLESFKGLLHKTSA